MKAARIGARARPRPGAAVAPRSSRSSAIALLAPARALRASARTSSRQPRHRWARAHIARAVACTDAASGPRNSHREVQPRRVGPAVVQVVAVVDEVDAADEGDLAVAHAQLLVQPAQLARLQPGVPAVERAEHLQLHAAVGEPARARAAGWRCEPKPSTTTCTATPRAAAPPGHRRRRWPPGRRGRCRWPARPRAARRRWPGTCAGTARRRPPAARRGCRRRSAAPARAAQCAAIRGRHRARRGAQRGSSSATSGRWSDMRAQAVPRGTIVERQARPRR